MPLYAVNALEVDGEKRIIPTMTEPENRSTLSSRPRPPTLKDIAEAAGVTQTTVSNVLLGREKNYSPATAEKIQELAKKMGYRRNSLARSLATRRSFTLGLVIEEAFHFSNPDNLYFVAFLQSFLEHAVAAKHQVKLIHQVGFDEDEIVPQVSDGSIDGLVGLVLSAENPLNHWLAGADYLPSVLVGGELGVDKPSTLDVDDRPSMAGMAEHLLELGHRDFWYVTAKGSHPSLVARQKGFTEQLAAKGIELSSECIKDTSMDGSDVEVTASAFLETEPASRPTALVCANDLVAVRLLHALQTQGIRVPEDVSISGFDGFPQGEWTQPTLTTVKQPLNIFGRRAAEILVKGSDGDAEVFHEVYPGELQVRGSTGAPCR